MPQAEARYVAGRGHGWLGEQPELHMSMVKAWLTGEELPAQLLAETSTWDADAVERLVGADPSP
jgi:hypothetical protein